MSKCTDCEAIEYAKLIIENYEMDIRNSMVSFGIDLVELGFCQGTVFKNAIQHIDRLVTDTGQPKGEDVFKKLRRKNEYYDKYFLDNTSLDWNVCYDVKTEKGEEFKGVSLKRKNVIHRGLGGMSEDCTETTAYFITSGGLEVLMREGVKLKYNEKATNLYLKRSAEKRVEDNLGNLRRKANRLREELLLIEKKIEHHKGKAETPDMG